MVPVHAHYAQQSDLKGHVVLRRNRKSSVEAARGVAAVYAVVLQLAVARRRQRGLEHAAAHHPGPCAAQRGEVLWEAVVSDVQQEEGFRLVL
eukprot:CAMPEP_0117681902 /NCGR_PEP_ID=MMETSP0804-20121206/19284_1 /TAXON_ID=1074897 /ORGANISM="Tetraselmis astigmatica, Strain CCMP880" /LENGTH=91 /DNA_ID=CAMNT_0005491799 /DNA_START=311 /DNA_END=586 /DNA_ORIENTATION=+